MNKYVLVALLCPMIFLFADAIDVPGTATDNAILAPIPLDRIPAQERGQAQPVWTKLECMDQETRENSQIQLVLERDATPAALQMASTIEGLWNTGAFEEALNLFTELGHLTDLNELCIGNAWRTPIPTQEQPEWGNDVRVGNQDQIRLCVLDRHTATGNLFAVILYDEGSNDEWAINISTDGGTTWTETYDWWATYELHSIDAVSVANHCYVAFGRGAAQDQGFLYRVRAVDGVQDTFPNGSNFITVFTTTSPDSINEVTLWSNQDNYDNRLYYGALINDGAVRVLWDDPDALSWTEYVTNITNAERGLDACWNQDYAARYHWLSYIDYNDSLCIHTVEGGVWSLLIRRTVGSGSPRYSSIGAYHDTIIVFYEYYPGTGNFIVQYRVTYNAGSSWAYGTVGDVDTTHEAPSVTARLGGGHAVVYRYYTPTRELRFTWRNYGGAWSTPVVAAETEPYYNQPSIQCLGGGVHGVLFLSWTTPYTRAAYFTRSDWTGVVEHKTSEIPNLFISLAPNPSRGDAKLSYTLSSSGHVSISIYDATGRMIDNPVNETRSAGTYSTNIDHGTLAAGIYFVRVETPDGAGTKTMTIIR